MCPAPTADPSAWPLNSVLHCARVPRALALRVAAVRRGVNLISGTVGSLPLIRWRDGVQIPRGSLLEQPESWRPYCRTLAETAADLVLYPFAWWLVLQRDAWTSYPTSVVRLDPEYVAAEREVSSDEVVREWATYKGKPVNPADLIRFDGPDEGLLTCAREDILTALALERAAARYASPEVPTGVLQQTGQYDLTDAEVDALLERWEARRRTSATAYLNPGLTYQPIASTAQELQLVEGREESVLQIARHLGIPSRYLAVRSGDSMTYSNLESQRRDLVSFTLLPYLNAIEQRLSMGDRNGSPRGQKVRFDLADFSRGIPLERAQRYQALIPLGVMSRAEAREAEDLDGPPRTPPAAAESPSPRQEAEA